MLGKLINPNTDSIQKYNNYMFFAGFMVYLQSQAEHQRLRYSPSEHSEQGLWWSLRHSAGDLNIPQNPKKHVIIIYMIYLILDMHSLWLLNTNWQLVDTSRDLNNIYIWTGPGPAIIAL